VEGIPRIAVVATHNRPAELRRLLRAVGPQCHAIVVIDNASSRAVPGWEVHAEASAPSCTLRVTEVIRDDEQPPNLSRLWNVGLDWARKQAEEWSPDGLYDVAVLNDDAIPPPGWWDAVSGAMRGPLGAVAGSSDPFDQLNPGEMRLWDRTAPMSAATRLAGWAFLLRGEWEGARFDERLRWWYGDDEISLRAREAGGLVHVGGFPVPNTGANASTVGVLAEQAGRDRAMFVAITGRQPW